jgi:NADPH2:quinone reductase
VIKVERQEGRGRVRAIQVREQGGPDVLKLVELPDPTPGAGQVVVEVAAAGVNFVDIYRRSGQYKVETPFVAGAEGAGTVSAVGSGVTDVAVGDRVAWAEGSLGSYASHAVVDAAKVVPLPAAVSFELGAAVLLQGLTAHYLATSTYPVAAGDWAVVHAGAGGVGLLLTQIIKLRGGHVLATVSTPEKAELARGAGADEVASYSDFVDQARALTGGAGVPVVYDGVGATTFDHSLAALRRRGYLVLYGASSGAVRQLNPMELQNAGSVYLTRPTMGHYLATRDEHVGRTTDLFTWLAEGKLSVRIGAQYPLADADKAQTDLASRSTTGKLLLIP